MELTFKSYAAYTLLTFAGAWLFSSCASSQFAPDLTPIAWSVPVNGFGPTVLSGDYLVGFAGEIGTTELIAVALTTHQVAWRQAIPQAAVVHRQVAANDNNIFALIAKEGFRVYTLAGELLVSVPPPSPDPALGVSFGAGPLVFKDILYVPNGNFLYAYSIAEAAKPVLVWRVAFQKDIWALALDDGSVYVSSATITDDNLFALNAMNGQVSWSTSTTYEDPFGFPPVPTGLAVSEEKVVASVANTIQAFDGETGERLWTSESLDDCPGGPGSASELEIAQNKVFLSPSTGDCVLAVSLETGSLLWTHSPSIAPDLRATYDGSPKYVDGVVYASNSRLWALDAETGEVLSVSTKFDRFAVSTTIHYVNGEILVWGDDLTAYKPIR